MPSGPGSSSPNPPAPHQPENPLLAQENDHVLQHARAVIIPALGLEIVGLTTVGDLGEQLRSTYEVAFAVYARSASIFRAGE